MRFANPARNFTSLIRGQYRVRYGFLFTLISKKEPGKQYVRWILQFTEQPPNDALPADPEFVFALAPGHSVDANSIIRFGPEGKPFGNISGSVNFFMENSTSTDGTDISMKQDLFMSKKYSYRPREMKRKFRVQFAYDFLGEDDSFLQGLYLSTPMYITFRAFI